MAVSPYVFAYSRRKAASAITADRSSEKRTRSFGACRSHMPSWAPKRRTSAPGTALARPLTRGIDPPLATKAGSLPRPSRSAVRAARYAGPSVAGSNPGPVSLGATVSGIPDGRRDSRWVTRRSRASLGSCAGWKRRFSRSARRSWASCTGSGRKPGKAMDGMAVNRSRSATRPSISASTRVLRSSPRSMVQPLRSAGLWDQGTMGGGASHAWETAPGGPQSVRTTVRWAEKSPHLPSGSLALSFTE